MKLTLALAAALITLVQVSAQPVTEQGIEVCLTLFIIPHPINGIYRLAAPLVPLVATRSPQYSS
jgi:hypothetical protein